MKVVLVGASGGIGQPLSLLLKLNKYISELVLFDLNELTVGVAKDLSHVNSNAEISGYCGKKPDFKKIFARADIVIVTAGVARKPGMTRDDLFKVNASIVRGVSGELAEYAPVKCKFLIVSNPVNSLIPVVVETFKKKGKLNSGNIMGVTLLDLVRAQTFLVDALHEKKAKKQSSNFSKQYNKKSLNLDTINVIGGHSPSTMVPLLLNDLLLDSPEEVEKLCHRVKYAGDEIVAAKNGSGSATLSMAYAAYYFVNAILINMNCDTDNEFYQPHNCLPCYVHLPNISNGPEVMQKLKELTKQDIEYFTIPVEFNAKSGSIKEINFKDFDKKLSKQQLKMVQDACKQLAIDIKKGQNFVTKESKL